MERAQAEGKEADWMPGTQCDPEGSEPCRPTGPGVLEPAATPLEAGLQGQRAGGLLQ